MCCSVATLLLCPHLVDTCSQVGLQSIYRSRGSDFWSVWSNYTESSEVSWPSGKLAGRTSRSSCTSSPHLLPPHSLTSYCRIRHRPPDKAYQRRIWYLRACLLNVKLLYSFHPNRIARDLIGRHSHESICTWETHLDQHGAISNRCRDGSSACQWPCTREVHNQEWHRIPEEAKDTAGDDKSRHIIARHPNLPILRRTSPMDARTHGTRLPCLRA